MRVLSVKVKPNAQQQTVRQEPDGSFVVQLKSLPFDGKANAELIQLLAKTLGVPKSAVRIKTGAGARLKRVEIDGLDDGSVIAGIG